MKLVETCEENIRFKYHHTIYSYVRHGQLDIVIG